MKRSVVMLAFGVVIGACGESATEPEVELQVIEETAFAASLGIDLSAMTRLESGVYVQDLVVGTGPAAIFGTTVSFNLTGWLSDGTQWTRATENLELGLTPTIAGIEDAVFLMPQGGVRLALIPPGRAYGSLPRLDASGNVVVPAGSILVFEIELVSVVERE
jgi:peptidylprolyl isomerase